MGSFHSGLAVLLIGALCLLDETRTEAPSFLVLVVDDWALSDLTAARGDDSPWNDLPVIDSLAARGQSWSNFYTQPICSPTRRSLLRGSYIGAPSAKVCAQPDATTPPADTLTVASHLKQLGYSTGTFGKWHIGPNPVAGGRWEDAPAAYGFDAWRAWNASNLFRHCGSRSYTDWYRVDDGRGRQTSVYHTQAVADAARDWWAKTAGPKLAYVCFQAPHPPFHVPPAELLPEGYPPPEDDRAEYEAMLVALDTAIASILEVVDEQTSYVLVLGDNGTPPTALRADQEPLRVKASTFEDGINVPFIVTGPGVAVGETEALGHAVDLLATLADLAGGALPKAPAMDSVSLAPVLRDGAQRVRTHVICERVSVRSRGRRSRDVAVVLQTASPPGLFKARWFGAADQEQNTRRIYDLLGDPGEQSPLDPQRPEYAELIRRLDALGVAYRNR